MLGHMKQRMESVVMSRNLGQTAEKIINRLEVATEGRSECRPSAKTLLPVAGQKRPASGESTSTAGSCKAKNPKRCLFCTWRLDRKTKQMCGECGEFICPDHTHKLCPQCVKKVASSQVEEAH